MYYKSYKDCQYKRKQRQEEALFLIKAAPLFYYISIDVIYLLYYRGYNCLIIARDNFSRWPKAKPIKNPISKKVIKFI